MASNGDSPRLSISEEKLKLLLGEMEWRLKTFFNEQLNRKAEAADMARLEKKLDALDRGDFTPVHQRALRDFFECFLAEGGDSKWKGVQRFITVVSLLISLSSVGITLAVLIHSGGL